MRRLFAAAALLACVAYVGCGEEKKNPASPSLTAAGSTTEPTNGATAGSTQMPFHLLHPVQFPMEQGIVAFPPRNEPNAFFANLQALYRDYLKRSQTAMSYVDSEGQNVWLTEYFRFYLNGCSHPEATSRTLAEIRTGLTYPVCGGESLVFPPRNLPYEFQAALEATYHEMLGRSQTASYVDSEGANVWLAEYLRYRVAGNCNHADAESRVFAQIQGQGVQPICSAPTSPSPPPFQYFVYPETRTVAATSGAYSIAVSTNRPDAQWTATSDQPSWLTVVAGAGGTGAGTTTYSVSSNPSASGRSGTIRVSGLSGLYPPAVHTVSQAGSTDAPYQYYVYPESRTVAGTSGTYSIAVSTNRPDAQWTATSDQPSWLTVVAGAGGTGAGTTTYSVSSNPSASGRSGRITVSGLSGLYPPAVHTVSQQGQSTPQSCTYGLTSPKDVSFGFGGGSGTATFTLTSGSCTWTASSAGSWVSLLDTSGTGNITIRYTVASNPGTVGRQATIEVRWPGPQAGENISITQSGR
jgi:hypothetical protein